MARPKTPILTALETQVMDIIWDSKLCSASEILISLEKSSVKRSNSALRSQLKSLVDKGYLGIRQEGITYYYFPKIMRNEAVEKTLVQVKRQFFNGSSKSIFKFLLQQDDITQSDLEEMQSELIRRSKEKSD